MCVCVSVFVHVCACIHAYARACLRAHPCCSALRQWGRLENQHREICQLLLFPAAFFLKFCICWVWCSALWDEVPSEAQFTRVCVCVRGYMPVRVHACVRVRAAVHCGRVGFWKHPVVSSCKSALGKWCRLANQHWEASSGVVLQTSVCCSGRQFFPDLHLLGVLQRLMG